MPKSFLYPTRPNSQVSEIGFPGHPLPVSRRTLGFLKEALHEDIGRGDVTSNLLIPAHARGEARVIARLLDHGPQVLATGGGAIMDQRTRDLIQIKGISIWLKADLDVLNKRTKRRGERPLVDKMKELLPLREPIYALSDIVVQSRDEPHDTIVDEIVAALPKHLKIIAGGETQS